MEPTSRNPNHKSKGQTGKILNSSLDSSLNGRGSEGEDALNTSMHSSQNSSFSVRDLNYQRINEQRLLNLVRTSPQKDIPVAKPNANNKTPAIKEIKKTPGTNSTASTEKGKDSRVQYKHYWKEAGI